MAFYYDDTRLMQMFSELEPKQRNRALRNGFRAAARTVRKLAIANLRASGLRSNRDVEKGIRCLVYRKVAGFRVTVGTKRSKRTDYSTMSAGEAKALRRKKRLSVVPLWAETGTERRETKKGQRRGGTRQYDYMTKTKAAAASTVEPVLKQNIVDYVEKTARKYGCIV